MCAGLLLRGIEGGALFSPLSGEALLRVIFTNIAKVQFDG
jgi:hypothetical protein